MSRTLKIIASSFLITATLIKAAPAIAEPAPAPNVSIVHTRNIDLSTAAGRDALDRRLAVAAFEVCGTASAADLAGKNKVRACRAEVLTRARAQAEPLASRATSVFVAAH